MNIRVKETRAAGAPVVTLDMEEYLVGVVASEMSNEFPVEALKAQAVAARTYALAHLNGKAAYDVDDTTKYQAYRKPAKALPNVEQAVKATAGVVVQYNGRLASTVYSASNGGETRSSKERWGSDLPYLPQQADPWDKAAGYPRNGHSVGMSQRGAQYAANHSVLYTAILAFYYPGTALAGGYGTAPVKPAPTKPSTAIDTSAYPEIYLGNKNDPEYVKIAQRKLKQLGYQLGNYGPAHDGVDGKYGKKTDDAVHAFKQKAGLPDDPHGGIGPRTWAALMK